MHPVLINSATIVLKWYGKSHVGEHFIKWVRSIVKYFKYFKMTLIKLLYCIVIIYMECWKTFFDINRNQLIKIHQWFWHHIRTISEIYTFVTNLCIWTEPYWYIIVLIFNLMHFTISTFGPFFVRGQTVDPGGGGAAFKNKCPCLGP